MRRRSSGRRPQSLAELRPAAFSVQVPLQARVLGLDPGSLNTGYAVLDCSATGIHYVASGAIRARGDEFADRLQQIFAGVSALVVEYQPQEVAIERVFMNRNADSALKLGQARGAAMCATFGVAPALFEYAPRAVKQAVVGTGAAEKSQVQLMVKKLLKLDGELGADAADAIAIALCHAHSRRMGAMLKRAAGSSR